MLSLNWCCKTNALNCISDFKYQNYFHFDNIYKNSDSYGVFYDIFHGDKDSWSPKNEKALSIFEWILEREKLQQMFLFC